MAIMNILLSAELTNWVGKLLELLYKGIGNFGWTVVVFSIILKLVLSPLDVWQRVSMKKQQKKMADLKPKLEKLEKQYGRQPDILKQKQYELQKESGMNIFSTCLPLIVTMVVFFVVFGGFRALVTYENELIVESLDSVYAQHLADYNYNLLDESHKTEATEFKGDFYKLKIYFAEENAKGNLSTTFVDHVKLKTLDEASYNDLCDKLAKKYEENLKDVSWLWVKNVFMSDTGTNVIPDEQAYTKTGAGGIGASSWKGHNCDDYSFLVNSASVKYNKTKTWDVKKWNGYFILPILSLLTSFLSTFIMQKTTGNQQTAVGTKEQAEQQQKTMKMMNYMMPIMLAVFAMLYSAAFAIYYFMSNVLSTITTLVVTGIMNAVDKKKEASNNSVIR